MNCLCCGRPLKTENESEWHSACIKRFFGTAVMPEIEIDEIIIETIAVESTAKGLTVPGVQKKLSLHLYSHGGKHRLTMVNYPTGYILKPQVEEFECLPEAEQLVMCMADITGISTVPHALVKNKDKYAYITKRIDRVIGNSEVIKLSMEDFCQLDYRLTSDKYRSSYERCAKIIEKYSSQNGLDMTELFMRLVFSFVVGNSDMHLKNFSMIEKMAGSENYLLSPAYDLVPVNLVMPEDKDEFALTMNGKKQNIRKKDFMIFAEECNISRISAERMISKIASNKDRYLIMCEESYLPEYMKKQFAAIIERRCKALA